MGGALMREKAKAVSQLMGSVNSGIWCLPNTFEVDNSF